MTRLTYEYKSKTGEVKIFSSYSQVMDEIMHHGGNYKAVYTPIAEPCNYVPKRILKKAGKMQ